MTCLYPRTAYRSMIVNANGKRNLVFSKKALADLDQPVTVPCGKCVQCRLKRSREIANRLIHESKFHECNSFITLTYDDQHLPTDRSLDVEVFKKFMKRLRKRLSNKNIKIKYYHCGEYGELNDRPHYHAIIFGYDFPDRELYKKNKFGDKLYTSEELSKCWDFGFVTVGDLTFESAAYVARYCVKKINGEKADKHYTRVGTDGNLYRVKPEYATGSQGLGLDFLKEYTSDIYPHDYVVYSTKKNTYKMKPPRYYDKKLEQIDEDLFHYVKVQRKDNAEKKIKEILKNYYSLPLSDRFYLHHNRIKAIETKFKQIYTNKEL